MTRIDSDPCKSKTSKFRVAISCPEKWKMYSVAQHKILLMKKNSNKTTTVNNGTSDNFIKEEKKPESALHKNKVPVDHIKKELEILHNNSLVIRNKMMALCSVRTSLLWLLKKSNLVERSLVG